MHMGDLAEAEVWLDRAAKSCPPGNLTILAANAWSYRTELAIRQGDVVSAETFFSYCLTVAEKTQATRSHAREMAMKTQLAALKEERMDQKALDSFVEMFERIKTTTCQDYTAESLFIGLQSAGREDQARAMVADFVAEHRRDLGALSAELQAIMNRMA
jgi:hypothetical protein